MYRISDIKSKATSFLDEYKQKDPAAFAAAQQAIGGLLILDGFIGIDNPLGGKKRSGIFGSLAGVIVGVIFIVIGFFGGGLFGLNNLTAQTTATVTAVGPPSATTTTQTGTSRTTSGGSCSLTVHYTVGGKDYTTASTMTSSNYCGDSVGSSISINYNPAKPGTWATDTATFKNVLKIFGFVGIFAVLASLVTFAIRLLSIIFGWKILRSGRALARTLPNGADLGSLIAEIRTAFSHRLFGTTPVPSSPLQMSAPANASVVNPQPYPPVANVQPPNDNPTPPAQ